MAAPLQTPQRVLVFEPYADLRAEIAATLRRESFPCDAVDTPERARLALNRSNYRYVVVDLANAGELLPELTPDSHLILLTESAIDDAGTSHATLRKPFTRDELIARLRS